MFTPTKNPTNDQLKAIIAASRHGAARRIVDEHTGDYWCWPFEQATHAEAAARLGIPYDRRPGEGDVMFAD